MLKVILAAKKKEVAGLRKKIPRLAGNLTRKKSLFFKTLKKNKFSVIAEIKRKSPTAGRIRPDLKPGPLARIYEQAGAAAISVLTDEKFFGARPGDLPAVKKAVRCPVLKKDFIIDEVQIYQAYREGADAVLLIAPVLSLQKLKKFLSLGNRLGLDCLVEVHNRAELKKVLGTGARIIGINNRNLKTGVTDLKATFQLVPLIPENKIVVSESGISTARQVTALKKSGVRAILVGESILKSRDISGQIKKLKEG